MASAVKRKLSSSDDGEGIKITKTATAGDTIHTAVAGTTAGTYDEIWLWAQNNHTADVVLTVEFGSADTENNIIVTIPFKSGLVPVVPGLLLQNESTVKAFAASANVITVHGFVNSITD
jgi:hypothetical protein